MKIAFFEVSQSEKPFLKKSKFLKDHEIEIFPEEISLKLLKEIPDCEILSTFIYSKVSADHLKILPKLQLIATRSTGFDHIDLTTCRARKIQVVNVPHYGENTVAEHTFALILSLSRNVHKAYIRTTRGDFSLEGLQGFDLKGKTMGIIGTGRIGLHVIQMAKGFGMKVLAHDPQTQPFLAEVLGFEYVPFDCLLSSSDIISLHCPYNVKTHHLINEERIKTIKKGALLINTARGGLVDTHALTQGLDSGILRGAGLDVLEEEEMIKEEQELLSKNYPEEKLRLLVQNHILLHRENVVITPHMAFNSREALNRILETTLQNMECFANGKPQNGVS
ncbi:MAG: hydroxyacid dehydrogenase [Chlamydiae bacterium]|nr:hydroxyacid dehydrogenase [Chlamydiota bacterium]MBI3266373.1 hydroxyacid dehydrogenase [Chlamydiota bacterium]